MKLFHSRVSSSSSGLSQKSVSLDSVSFVGSIKQRRMSWRTIFRRSSLDEEDIMDDYMLSNKSRELEALIVDNRTRTIRLSVTPTCAV